jgi:nucleotide-binding universal stress UspA family protein
MGLIKKILVAIDGSEHADKALNFALDLAERYSAAITLINVFQAPMFSYPIVGYLAEPPYYPVTWEDFLKKLKPLMKRYCLKLLKGLKN